MIALQPNAFLTGIRRLLFTNKRGAVFPAQTTAKINWKLLSQYQYVPFFVEDKTELIKYVAQKFTNTPATTFLSL